MTIKEIPYTVYPPCGERTEWTVRFHNINNVGGGGDTLEEALVDAYKNIEFEIDYLKNKGIINKQERIDKIKDIVWNRIREVYTGGDIVEESDADDAARWSAEALIEAGYINGANFVEWLKNYKRNNGNGTISYLEQYEIAFIKQALQEYLK